MNELEEKLINSVLKHAVRPNQGVQRTPLARPVGWARSTRQSATACWQPSTPQPSGATATYASRRSTGRPHAHCLAAASSRCPPPFRRLPAAQLTAVRWAALKRKAVGPLSTGGARNANRWATSARNALAGHPDLSGLMPGTGPMSGPPDTGQPDLFPGNRTAGPRPGRRAPGLVRAAGPMSGPPDTQPYDITTPPAQHPVQPTPLARASAGRESRRSALPDAHVDLVRLPAGRLTATLARSLDSVPFTNPSTSTTIIK